MRLNEINHSHCTKTIAITQLLSRKGGKFLKRLWSCVGGNIQDNLVLSTELIM